ncbi:MAG: T9SS type A sorting domain-containing protein [Bacteroidetes bacterium]|nr:T9SS type A sorting domain-containing protein [Bacteroidota bacterium]
MKKSIYTLLIVLLGLNTSFAQISFSVTPNPNNVIAPPTIPDTAGHGDISNLTNQTKNLRWERLLISVPPSMQTQVCDPNACYLPGVSARNFSLAPNQQNGDMDVHFLNNTGLPQEAIVHLKITNQDNNSEVLTVVYTYNSFLTDIEKLQIAPNIKVFPNPATEFFTLKNADAVKAVRVFGLDGREIAFWNASPDQVYNIQQLASGPYVIALLNEQGHTLKAVELVKQ